jgi:hypothetical protein
MKLGEPMSDDDGEAAREQGRSRDGPTLGLDHPRSRWTPSPPEDATSIRLRRSADALCRLPLQPDCSLDEPTISTPSGGVV